MLKVTKVSLCPTCANLLINAADYCAYHNLDYANLTAQLKDSQDHFEKEHDLKDAHWTEQVEQSDEFSCTACELCFTRMVGERYEVTILSKDQTK